MVRLLVENNGCRLVVDGISDDELCRCLVEEIRMCLQYFEVEVVC